jgi:hypothetical protein
MMRTSRPGPGSATAGASALAAILGLGLVGPLQAQAPSGLVVNLEARTVSFPAVVRSEAFQASLPPDHQYHAVVHEDGGAAGKALFTTPVPDTEIARALRALGADDGGGVPLAAWQLRWVPVVPQPASRVSGTPITVTVDWEEASSPQPLSRLLEDPGGRGIDMRFGGNEDHADEWHSGCILCLFSCPGGVISNAAYSIRDHQRAVTTFDPSDRLPPDGTPVTITLQLDPG